MWGRGGGRDECHLRVFPPGQLLRRPSTPKRFCLSSNQVFSIFCDEVFCVCFPVVQGFSLRLLCLFSNCLQFKFFIYSLYIHIYIFYIFSLYLWCLTVLSRIMIVLTLNDRPDPQLWGHCRSTHNSSMICFFLFLQWFLFGILMMDGMSERNHCHIIFFSLHCFNGFSVASWRIMQHVIEKPLPYN